MEFVVDSVILDGHIDVDAGSVWQVVNTLLARDPAMDYIVDGLLSLASVSRRHILASRTRPAKKPTDMRCNFNLIKAIMGEGGGLDGPNFVAEFLRTSTDFTPEERASVIRAVTRSDGSCMRGPDKEQILTYTRALTGKDTPNATLFCRGFAGCGRSEVLARVLCVALMLMRVKTLLTIETRGGIDAVVHRVVQLLGSNGYTDRVDAIVKWQTE